MIYDRDVSNMIFVFGSNLSGIHGAGAARYAAVHRGAVYGVGEGITGSSYALPTKGLNISEMPLEEIHRHINKFIAYAANHQNLEYQVTAVGTGLSGFKHFEIAPLFAPAVYPDSTCYFDKIWLPWLPKGAKFWGTSV